MLDQSIINLAKAIRDQESGNNFNARGKDGEMGAYQFMPATWKGWAKEHLGDANAPMTRENQNKVAYKQIEKWKKEGLNIGQIASAWNAGYGNKDAYLGTHKGISKGGAAYDTPAYAKEVAARYQLYKRTTPPLVDQSPETLSQRGIANPMTGETYPAPVAPEKRSVFDVSRAGIGFSDSVLRGETTYPAQMNGAQSIPGNLARTAGNIPSSGAKLVRGAIAPVNPLDIHSPINIGSNLVQSAEVGSQIFKDRGLLGGLKDIASGTWDNAKKIFKAPGEFIVGMPQKSADERLAFAEGIAKKGIEDPLLVPSLLYGGPKAAGAKGDAISRTASVVTRGADTSLDAIDNAISSRAAQMTAKSETQIDSIVLKNFQKGVKPTIPGKATALKAEQYKDNILLGVKTIDKNKGILQFTDDSGEIITGRNPRSLQELMEAQDQTKKEIFAQYDKLAKQAGDAGVTISFEPIASELDSVINSKALKLSNPKVVQYAEDVRDRYLSAGSADPMVVQEVVQNYNKSLEAFYKNPSYDLASQVAVDALVVNKLRGMLDESITGLTGTQYSALKVEYGALKAIEKDVVKAALRDARKNVKGLIDFTDIFTGGQAVTGLLRLDPSLLAGAAVQKGFKEWIKYLNDPNRAVERMFKAVEKR